MPRTPLLHPGRYFAERAPRLDLRTTVAVLLAVSVLTTAGIGAIGWLFAEELDVTVAVDNPNRPPDWVCDRQETDASSTATDAVTMSGCDQSATTRVAVGSLLWEKFSGLLPLVFLATLFGPVLVAGVAQFVTGRMGGEGPFADTLAVSVWAAVPGLVQAAVAIGQFWWTLQRTSFSGDASQVAATLERLSATSPSGAFLLVTLAVTCWQAYVWHRGLLHARRMDPGEAAPLVLVVAVLDFLLQLAN